METRSIGPQLESLSIIIIKTVCLLYLEGLYSLFFTLFSMPLHCCVPQCTSKGYLSASGDKISYFNFPKDADLRKKWIFAIRREPGKDFQLTFITKVCSRHFKPTELKKSLNGIITLKHGSVPSEFAWSGDSPRKRKAPATRSPLPLKAAKPSTSTYYSELLVCQPSVEDELKTQLNEVKENNVVLEERVKELETELSKLKEEKERLEKVNKEITIQLETEHCEAFESMFINDKERAEEEKIIKELREQLRNSESNQFNLENFKSDDNIAFYTGFPNFNTFLAIFKFLNTGEKGENVRYCSIKEREVPDDFYDCDSEDNDEDDDINKYDRRKSKRGRPRKLIAIEEFFIVMCRLRRGFAELHLAHLFRVSLSTISRIFITYINYMYLKFGQICIWPSKEIVSNTMPEAFKDKYPSTRVIIDCTEIRCEMPSGLLLNTELFSSYKNHVTFKALVGIAPSGAITFISQLYTGSISEREIVTRSGFLEQKFEDGDSVMADKGFTIQDLLPLGVSLNIPPFLGENAQMSKENIIKTQQIASVRIHIERAINKIKNFHIWDGVVPLSLIGVVNQMWSVCAFLCNAHDPLISA